MAPATSLDAVEQRFAAANAAATRARAAAKLLAEKSKASNAEARKGAAGAREGSEQRDVRATPQGGT
ncbi:hypothetical protein QP162_19195 [Sphingomonas aurantiaca]|uniref:hypothetical protein n=1 Tax=Sphingomonas aurantiaca TaxID=185949 RepID=UPI002FE3861B